MTEDEKAQLIEAALEYRKQYNIGRTNRGSSREHMLRYNAAMDRLLAIASGNKPSWATDDIERIVDGFKGAR